MSPCLQIGVRIKGYYTYILATGNQQVLTVGVTANLPQLVQELSNALEDKSFKTDDNRLVYYETFIEPAKALSREKRINDWKREWQIWLIEDQNPQWSDLGKELLAHSACKVLSACRFACSDHQ